MFTMALSDLLLLVALRYDIDEPDLDTGLLRVAAIAGRDLDPACFHSALAQMIADGYIHDPIQLRAGALQCRWHLELALPGIAQVMQLYQATDELTLP